MSHTLRWLPFSDRAASPLNNLPEALPAPTNAADSTPRMGRVSRPPASVLISLLLVCLILGTGVYVLVFYLK